MNVFIVKLAVAVIPLILLVALVVILDRRTRKSFYLLCLRNNRRNPLLKSIAVAATLRWF